MRVDSGVSVRPKATAETIVGAAEQLFRVHGYHRATVSTLAKGLEMSPANVYRFYRSKEDLRRAVFGRILERGYSLTRQTAHQPLTASARMRRILLLQHVMTVSLVTKQNTMCEFLILGIHRDKVLVDAHIARLRRLFAVVIADGIIGGEFADQVDIGRAAMTVLLATVKIWHPELLVRQRRLERSEIDLLRFVLEALRTGNVGA